MGVAAKFCVRALRAIVKKPLSEILATPLPSLIREGETAAKAAQILNMIDVQSGHQIEYLHYITAHVCMYNVHACTKCMIHVYMHIYASA